MEVDGSLAKKRIDFHKQKPKPKLLKDLTAGSVSSGIISAMLAIMGPPAIILEAANAGQLTYEQTISWMFAVYFFGGLFGIILSMIFKIPITGAHSLSGVAFLVTITPHYTFSQLIGAYVLAGIIIFIVGISGVFTKLMKWFPKEIVAAMLGGMVTTYVVRLITSVHDSIVVGIPAILCYLIFTKWIKRIPAVLGAATVALLITLLTENINLSEVQSQFILPNIYIPEFSIIGIFTISLPLALIILSNDVAPGIGALESTGFSPPIKKIVTVSGIFSMFTSFLGGQSANIAGMMTAICASDDSGPREKRYVASIVSGILIFLFGIFSWKVIPFIKVLPIPFLSMMTGFALLGVLGSSLQLGFSKTRYRIGTTFAFTIALSNISFFYISAPVLALIMGSLIAKFLENKD